MKTNTHPWLKVYEELGLDWSRVSVPEDKTLSDYVRDHARHFPDREALVFLGRGLTYAQLDTEADHAARVLQNAGCRAGDVLGIQLPNVPQYVIAFIAAARAGMVSTSISPLMTPPEIRHQATDAGVRVLLTMDSLHEQGVARVLDELPGLQEVLVAAPDDLNPADPDASPVVAQDQPVRVRGFRQALRNAQGAPDEAAVSLDEVLYLQYTGGTTGMPKGARLSSRNLFTNSLQADAFYQYRVGAETVASAFPLFHIGGAAVLFNALRTASTFMLIPDPRNLEHFVGEMKVRPPTVLAAVPALYQMLCHDEGFVNLDFSQLRIAVSGAAPFAAEEVKVLENIIGPDKFCEVYGMTETSPVQTLNPASRLKPGSVGIPVPGTEVRIVDTDHDDREQPPGEAGEIIVHGPQVMQGYLNLPEATRESLREIDGRRWMFTGDIGYLDEEGYLTVCDRSKDMLIVGGYKVFSVEVENKAQTLPWVALCAVVGRPDEKRPGNDIVQLYVQCHPGEGEDEVARREELEQYCRANLSPYKVPREIQLIDEIPLTSVGKIDKKALRSNTPSPRP